MLLIIGIAFCSWSQPKQVKEIAVPQGYTAADYPAGSYSNWITNLVLKQDKTIKTYNGSVLTNHSYNVLAVINMPPIFQENLEQAPDYCFRFWGEYHKDNNIEDKLSFLDYNGNKRPFKSSVMPYLGFLKTTLSNTNSYAIKKGCREIPEAEAMPGDMIVQNRGGGAGHVSIIINVCKSAKGDQLYLIGFGFSPAQEVHIEKASDAYGKQGWYTLKGYYEYLQDNFDFGSPVLRRFED